MVSPDRDLLALAANRNLIRDTVAVTRLDAAQRLTDEHPSAISFGGPGRSACVGEGFSSVAQTYADLFAMPGWQASEFRIALHARLFDRADWEQPADEAHA